MPSQPCPLNPALPGLEAESLFRALWPHPHCNKGTHSTSVPIPSVSVHKEQGPFWSCFLFKRRLSAECWNLLRLLPTGYFTTALLLGKLNNTKINYTSHKPRFKGRQSCNYHTEPMFSNRSEGTLLSSCSETVSLFLTYKSDQFSHLLHYCLFHFYTFYGADMHTSIYTVRLLMRNQVLGCTVHSDLRLHAFFIMNILKTKLMLYTHA